MKYISTQKIVEIHQWQGGTVMPREEHLKRQYPINLHACIWGGGQMYASHRCQASACLNLNHTFVRWKARPCRDLHNANAGLPNSAPKSKAHLTSSQWLPLLHAFPLSSLPPLCTYALTCDTLPGQHLCSLAGAVARLSGQTKGDSPLVAL